MEKIISFNIENLSRKSRVLSKKEFKDLHDKWVIEDCEDSYLEMLKNNLPLVHKLSVGRSTLQNVCKDDLIQSGIIGLMKAIEKFEPEFDYAFSTYAVAWINDYINREIDNNGNTIRIPISRSKEARKYLSVMKNLPVEKQNEQGVYEFLSKEDFQIPNFSPERIKIALERIEKLNCLSLDRNNDNTGDDGLVEKVVIKETSFSVSVESHEQMFCREESQKQLMETITTTLTDRESKIVISRFGLNSSAEQTLKELAERFGVTHERVRQIEKEALQKIRKAFKRIGLDNFSDFL